MSSETITFPRFATGLALLVSVWFANVLFGWRSFYTRDFSNFGYPLAYHMQQSCLAGDIPLWNQYNFAGLPFLAQWNTLSLYPFSLIYVLLPLPWSLNFFNLLHLYLGGLGMFALSHRWFKDSRASSVAGAAYAFGGLTVSALMWPNNVAALGWLPLVWAAGERAAREGGNRCVTAALVTALQFLTGAPEIVGLTWIGLVVLPFLGGGPDDAGNPHSGPRIKNILARLSAVFLAALGLTAIQWLPFLELLRRSQRGFEYATSDWSLAWAGLGNFLVPLFRTVKDRDGIFFQPNQQWVTSYYAGLTVLFLAVIGLWVESNRRVRWLGWLGLLSCVLALGPNAGLYDWLRKVVPALGIVRYPIKFIVLVAVILPLLAGCGARALLEGKVKRTALRWAIGGLISITVGLLIASRWKPIPGEVPAATLQSGAASLGCLLLLWGATAWQRRAMSAGLRWLLPVTITLIVCLDLFCANYRLNPVTDPRYMDKNIAELSPRPVVGEARAMLSSGAHNLLDATIFPTAEIAVKVPRQSLMLNANLLEGVPKLDGFFSLYLPRPAFLIARLGGATNITQNALLDFLGVSHVSRASKPWAWDPRPQWLPLMTLAPRVIFLGITNTPARLLSAEFNPREEVFLPLDADKRVHVDGQGHGRILTQRVASHLLEASVEADRPMMLVLAQADYPGWRATVNGRAVPIWTANYAFQAIELPAGRHEVRVRFRSNSFELGAILSLVTAAGCLMFVISSLAKDNHHDKVG